MREDYDFRVLCPYYPALGHVGSMMANGGEGEGDGTVGKEGVLVREMDGEEAGVRLNVHELGRENENDEEGGSVLC